MNSKLTGYKEDLLKWPLNLTKTFFYFLKFFLPMTFSLSVILGFWKYPSRSYVGWPYEVVRWPLEVEDDCPTGLQLKYREKTDDVIVVSVSFTPRTHPMR